MENFIPYPAKADYTTNAASFADHIARHEELMKYLSHRVWEYDKELSKRFAEWDSKIAAFDSDVMALLELWITDGTFADIINNEIFNDLNKKIENVAIDITSFPYNAAAGTDIGTVLTSVIDTVYALGGGVVKIPAGTYIINGSVDLPSNIKLVGDAGATILKKDNAATEGFMFTAGKTTKFGATTGYGGGAKNISFEGIEFHGHAPSVTETKALALSFHHVHSLNFDNCRFYNCITQDHAIDLAGCSDVLITNCSFEGAFNIAGREYNECIQIDTSAPTALPGFHSYDGLPTKNVTVRECQFLPSYYPDGTIFTYAPHPIGNHGYTGGKPYENIVFENNLVKDGQPKTSGAGWRGWIHFYGTKHLKIKNNRFINTQGINAAVISVITSSGGRYDPITFEAGTGIPTLNSDIEVTGNTFEGFNNMTEKLDLVRMYGTEYLGVEYPVKNVLVSNNVFLNNAGDVLTSNLGQTCVHISLFEFVTVADNLVDMAGRMFSVWDGEHVTVTGNNGRKLSNSFLYHSTVKHSTVVGNTVHTSRVPLEMQEVTNVICSGNIFTDAVQYETDNYAIKMRHLINANVIGNLVQTNSVNMLYGWYFYETDQVAENINNFDNMAIGFTSRPYNISGVMTGYVER